MFTYVAKDIRKLLTFFRSRNVQLEYRVNNILHVIVNQKYSNIYDNSERHKLKCKICNMTYVGQKRRKISTGYKQL